MGGTRNLKLGRQRGGKGQGTGGKGNRCMGPVGQMSTSIHSPQSFIALVHHKHVT